jgi:hypothetical protein
VLACIRGGLATGMSLIQGVQPTVYILDSFKINCEWGKAKELNSSVYKKNNEGKAELKM